MALPIDNVLQQVQTYQMANLAFLQNLMVFTSTSNLKYKNFQRAPANLGDTVTFDLTPRFVGTPSLVANFEAAKQRVHSLTVDEQHSVSYSFSNQQEIFNLDANAYLKRFGKAAMYELATIIESDIAEKYCVDHTYRFFGTQTAGIIDPINSYTQLGAAIARFKNYGAAQGDIKFYLQDVAVPPIVGNGLGQFAPKRNDDTANSWEIGRWQEVDYYYSNLLPLHTAGTVGNNEETLTITAISVDGTTLTMSGASINEPVALAKGDLLTVGAAQLLKYLTFIGHKPSVNDVQVRVEADASSDGAGEVIATIFPALISDLTDANANLSAAIVPATTTVTAMPNHRAGLICSGDAKFMAMPQLPTEVPYPTANEVDPDTGVSIRMYYGSKFAENERGFVNDVIWGATGVDEYSMRVLFPV